MASIVNGTTSYQLINLTADLNVFWPSSFSTQTTIANFNDVMPTNDGFAINMPDATLASNQKILFNNVSLYDFNVNCFDGTTLITVVEAGKAIEVFLYNSTTQNGLWRVLPYGGGTNAISNITIESTSSTINVTDGVVTNPGGTVDLNLPTSLFNLLDDIITPGLACVKSIAPQTWGTVSLVGDGNILITNDDAVAGDPVFSLASAITGISSLEVGTLTISGEVITTNNINGNINIVSAGTGNVFINGVTIDVNGNISTVNNLTVAGTFNVPLLPKIFCSFTDTIVGPSNTLAISDSVGISTVTGSAGVYVLTFETAFANTNYSVFFSFDTTEGPIPLMLQGGTLVKEVGSVTIAVALTSSSQLVESIPHGISVFVMSSNI